MFITSETVLRKLLFLTAASARCLPALLDFLEEEFYPESGKEVAIDASD